MVKEIISLEGMRERRIGLYILSTVYMIIGGIITYSGVIFRDVYIAIAGLPLLMFAFSFENTMRYWDTKHYMFKYGKNK